MTPETPSCEAEALDWTLRVQDPDFADWDALTAWLEADPRHADCFHRLTLQDDEVAAVLREVPPLPAQAAQAAPVHKPGREPVRKPGRKPPPAWTLMAAGLVLAIVLGAVLIGRARLSPPVRPSSLAVVTRPGERRELRLPDGTVIEVAGATRLTVDPAARSARLDEGQASFSVTHDPSRRFAVRMGDAVVTDVGTVFDLSRRDGRSVVAVAQGEVRVEGVGAPVDLTAGRRLRFSGGSARALEVIAPDAATAWQQGRFSYADASIAEVAADIEHATGARIRLSPQAAAQRFAGAIRITGDAGRTLQKLAPVLGLSVSRDGDVWVLEPAQAAHRG